MMHLFATLKNKYTFSSSNQKNILRENSKSIFYSKSTIDKKSKYSENFTHITEILKMKIISPLDYEAPYFGPKRMKIKPGLIHKISR